MPGAVTVMSMRPAHGKGSRSTVVAPASTRAPAVEPQDVATTTGFAAGE